MIGEFIMCSIIVSVQCIRCGGRGVTIIFKVSSKHTPTDFFMRVPLCYVEEIYLFVVVGASRG